MLSGHAIRMYRVHHPFETFMESNANFVAVRPLSYGLVVSEYVDNSIRLVSIKRSHILRVT